MNIRNLVVFLLVLGVIVTFASYVTADSFDRVLLEDVKVLTLQEGKFTKGRRSSPIPQLKCVGGSAYNSNFKPKVVQCKNMGFDGADFQWRCEADMDSSVRFGALQVSCEGYDYPEDKYILAGSCGLEYELEYTEEGRERQQQQRYGGGGGGGTFGNSNFEYGGYHRMNTSDGMAGIFTMIVLGVIIYIFYRVCTSPGYTSPVVPGAGPDFGGGYPGGGYPGGGYPPGGCPPPTYATYPGVAPGGGGFWSGMATGGLLGYLMGRPRTYGYGYAPTYTTPYVPSYGGGGGGSFRTGGGGSSSSSGGSRTTAGFGGTSRR